MSTQRRRTFWLVVVTLAILLVGSARSVYSLQAAPTPAVTLVGRAVLPAKSFADGPASGKALANQKQINGIAVPFANQPFGSVTALVYDPTNDYWLLLTGQAFNTSNVNANASGDVWLRIYLAQIDWRTSSGSGGGAVNPLDWITFADPVKRLASVIPTIQDASDANRYLTGVEFNPLSLIPSADGKSYWIGESHLPALLQVTTKGVLAQAPQKLQNVNPTNGLQGIGANGQTLLVASHQTGSATVTVSLLAPSNLSVQKSVKYQLDQPTDQTRGWVLINDHQALVLESDPNSGANAKIKRVYLADLSQAANGTVQKTLVADLLKIDDPSNLGTDPTFGNTAGQFGLQPFVFPYADVSGIYPVSPDTLAIVNDNHLPFNTGRAAGQAEPTDFIEIKLAAPLDLNLQPFSP